MAEGVLPPTLAEFVARFVHTVEQLEILCLLSAPPLAKWSVKGVFARIQSSEKSIEHSLQQFVEAGLVQHEADGSYRFSPRDSKLLPLMAALRNAYQQRPVSVIQAIYATRPPPPLSAPAETQPPTPGRRSDRPC
ncbi:MAG TPA: hypothetical protein VHI52_19330 [Verrucomicrobiae bacterium]|nr:hypothetical protein [Verrucomicrobiae bacterium]